VRLQSPHRCRVVSRMVSVPRRTISATKPATAGANSSSRDGSTNVSQPIPARS